MKYIWTFDETTFVGNKMTSLEEPTYLATHIKTREGFEPTVQGRLWRNVFSENEIPNLRVLEKEEEFLLAL